MPKKKKKKKNKRRQAETAADLLLEGGMSLLPREDLTRLVLCALRQDAMQCLPGYISYDFVNHGDGCWSLGNSFRPLKDAAKKLRA